MSTIVMSACWPLQMPSTPKSVLISLADNANDHGECWPSIAKICERTCLKKTAVIDAIKWLESTGLLLADRSNGRHSRYAIDLRAVDQGTLFGNEPVRQTDRSAKQTGAPAEPDRYAKRTAPVRQTDTNRKEPSRTVSKEIALDLSSWPSLPNVQVLADWLDLRKRKRAPITETALRGMGAQLHRAAAMGYDVDAALTECVLRGWQGLNADWLQPNQHTQRSGLAAKPGKQMQGLMALEGLKSGNRLDSGRNSDGAAEALPALAGPNTRR